MVCLQKLQELITCVCIFSVVLNDDVTGGTLRVWNHNVLTQGTGCQYTGWLETILGWGGLLITCQVCSYYLHLMQNITAVDVLQVAFQN